MISEELLIKPLGNCIQLVPPTLQDSHSFYSIKSAFQLPVNIYFQQHGCTILHCNEHTLISTHGKELGFYSHNELKGIRFEKLVKKECAEQYKKIDLEVLDKNRMIVVEENGILHDDTPLQTLSFKFPCYLDGHSYPFIFGISIILNNGTALADGLQHILSLGLFPSKTNLSDTILSGYTKNIAGIEITKQQFACLKLAMKGMTAKKIANVLGISYRTVEHHFENLKKRFNVKYKSELLEKIMYYI